MKHNPSKFLSILFAVPFVCMCSRENLQENTNEPATTGEQVTITATMSNTKVNLTQGTGELLLTWSEGDALMVVGNTSEIYNIVDDGVGIGSRTATFSGTSVEGEKFTVYYPATYENVEALTARSYEGQVQTGNGNLGHLEYNTLAQELDDFRTVNFGEAGVLNNGVLKLVVKLPEAVTEVASISISAPEEIFYTTNGTEEKTATLSLGFENCEIGENQILTAYLMTSWQDVTIASGTKLTVDVTVPGRPCRYTKTISKNEDITLNGGACLTIDISDATVLNHVLSGSGTETDPYLLYDAEDMVAMNGLLVAEKKTFFKMMEDIDMKGIDWVGGNQASPYRQDIDFDGCDHTISNFSCTKSGVYAGFIGVLSGRIANVTFENPIVEAKSKHSGIICGYAGSSGTLPAVVENVTIKGGKVTQSANCHTGFIFGHSNVTGCKYTNITIIDGVLNQNGIGDSGFIGGAQNIAATYTNCHVSGTLTLSSTLGAAADAQNICSGGIQGYDAGSTYKDCSFTGTINGGRLCGGIAGYNKVAGVNISGCHVNATIESVKIGDAPGEEVGGIIGWVESGNISECDFRGSLTAAGKEVGGIAGMFKGNGEIKKCDCFANITTSSGYVGGIAGRLSGGTITECTVQTEDGSKISNTAGNNVGGIVGWNENGDVSKCYVNMDITAPVSYVGGIIGNFYKGTISDSKYFGQLSANAYVGGIAGSAGISKTPTTTKITGCFSNASINAPNGNVGGICGIVESGASDSSRSIVENCYSLGDIQSSNGQFAGGILGDVKSNVDVKYCYATGSVTGLRGVGGVIGRVANGGSNGTVAASSNSVISCHAYNSSIKSTQTGAGYGSGTIGGFVIIKNTFKDCYRHPAFGNNDSGQTRFTCGNEPNELPVDQGLDINASNPIAAGIKGTTSARGALSMQYTYPFHGNVADNDCDTMIKLATKLSWDTNIWDLTGEYPTLKNNPEPAVN